MQQNELARTHVVSLTHTRTQYLKVGSGLACAGHRSAKLEPDSLMLVDSLAVMATCGFSLDIGSVCWPRVRSYSPPKYTRTPLYLYVQNPKRVRVCVCVWTF